MHTLKAVSFDLEGPLIDAEIAHHLGFLRAVEEFGYSLSFEQANREIPGWIGGGDMHIATALAARIGGCEPCEIVARKMVHYRKILATLNLKPRPGFLNVYTELARREIPMGIGSLTPTNQANELMEITGLTTCFRPERVVLLEDIGEANKKPKPDVYLETARRLGVTPHKQLVFEDSVTGVLAARAAGSLVVAMPVYKNHANIRALLEAGACRVFWDWRDINILGLMKSLQDELVPQ